MAFENVFGNVRFDIPVQAQQNAQNNLITMLGRVIQQKQFQQEMDFRERQLASQGQEFNLKKTAELALLKQNMGMPINEQEAAAITTMAQVAPPTYTTDQLGRTVAMPSGWSGLRGFAPSNGTNTPNYAGVRPSENAQYDLTGNISEAQGDAFLNNLMLQTGQRPAPPMPLPPSQMQPPEDMGAPDAQTQDFNSLMVDMAAQDAARPYQAGGMLAGTPKGAIMEEEFQKDVSTEAAKADIDLRKSISLKEAEADISFRKEQMKTEAGRQKVQNIITKSMDDLEEINDKLKAKQAIITNDSNILDNLKNKYGNTWLGRHTTSVTKPEIEKLRQEYNVKRDSIIPSYIAYFDLPATVVDTEEFQQRILQSFGDPSLIYETNAAALENMRNQFGLPKKEGASNEVTTPSQGAIDYREYFQ